ncbi:MAG: hypothetical protein M1823_006023 [Watsoniomyces obsoletus]|nr:MAG: hypothetical protein M1823_006023 [Watsoniomyces obsoletus]
MSSYRPTKGGPDAYRTLPNPTLTGYLDEDHRRAAPKTTVESGMADETETARTIATETVVTDPPHLEGPLEGDIAIGIEKIIKIDMETTVAAPMWRWAVLSQVSEQLKKGYHVDALKDVRVIKDRHTGESRQFGFLNFGSIAAAKAFVDENHPSIFLYGGGSGRLNGRDQATKVRISFCRERAERDRDRPEVPDDDWTCHVCSFPNFARRSECRKCQTLRTDPTVMESAHVLPPVNTGDSDVSPDGTPSQFLLFRGLEATVTAQLLAKGAAKLYKSTGNSPPPPAASKKAGLKVSSTTAGSSFGAKNGSVRRVLLVKDRRTDASWRYGFVEFASAEDSQAALAKYNSLDKFTISSKPVMLSFIHAGVFVPVLDGRTEDKFTFSPLHNPAMKLAYWDDQAYLSELVLANDDDQASANDSLSKPTMSSVEDSSIKSIKEGDVKNKKRKTEVGASSSNKKTVPAHLNFWRNRHAELHGLPTESEAATSETSTAAKAAAKSREDEDNNNNPPTQSYADMNRKCCLLCARQFKTEGEVNKHERLSQLHRDNLNNEEMKIKAHARLARAGIDVPDAPAYRDRARERRVMFNQPRRPAPDPSASKPVNSPPKEEPKEEKPVQSKGAALLGKMGWTAGEGLGAQGTGITAPVATEMYVQGVGLGHESGKVGDAVDEAQRNTAGGYGQFLERGKDKAKERFQRMS